MPACCGPPDPNRREGGFAKMTDFSFFESQSDDMEPNQDLGHRFACARRFVDLTHLTDAQEELVDPQYEELPAHPEIVELIESLLTDNPTAQPAREMAPSQRVHSVFIPEHYEAGYSYPLIVWFHGDGGSESELADVMPSISDRNYIGVALRGDLTSGNGFGWTFGAAPTPELIHDVRSIVTSLRREYHIHSERIYLAGFGSGATTAIQLMLARPEWFGGVISFSGEMPKEDTPLVQAEDLKDKRILLTTSIGSATTRVGDVVAAGRMLYSVGMQVGTRVYQNVENSPTPKMLRDLNSWLMDDICSNVKV
jgi:phospholipase/carboxylesterase